MAKTVAIFSTKGGVGKTLIAANLAVSLAQDYQKKTCLLDFDIHAVGDMARMLNVAPEKSMADLIAYMKKHPDTVRKESFIKKTQDLDFIQAVILPQQVTQLDPNSIKDAFSLYEKDYDYLIVDAGKNFSDVFVSVLNQANLILLVVTPDILSVYQTKWILDTLQFLHFPLSMVKLVLNRSDSLSGISWQQIGVSLPVEIISKIPSEGKAVGLAINRSTPVVIDNPKSRFSIAIKQLAYLFTTESRIFIEHSTIDEIKLKEAGLEKSADFWEKLGLTEYLSEGNAAEDLDEILLLKRRIHKRLIDELNLKKLDLEKFSDYKKNKELRVKAESLVTNLMAEEAGSFISSHEVRQKLIKEIIDEALGLGPLEDLLADPSITDIMVNNRDEVYIERNGKLELSSKKFVSNAQLKTVIERILAPIGRRIDESVPMVDARLPDGSRVNAIIPPLSLTGPTLTIRKFRKEVFKIKELIELGTLNWQMAEFIQACVVTRKNIIVSGGTGSGKTTVLNILSGYIPDDERIITIEDAAELKLRQEHWVRLESRPPNIEGRGAVTIRDIFRNSLRMRPERILIGECRGVETLDMLQAMNTGHDGSMTTIHANSTHDVLSRLDSMILMSGIELPVRAIREMTASAINLIIHTARLSDGTRKIIQISEVAGLKDEMHINLQDVFAFRQIGLDENGKVLGNFEATGYIPSFVEEMGTRGIKLSANIFAKSSHK